MLPTDPAERHRTVAARFSALVEGATDWSAPSPVPEWDARGVVAHLTTWAPDFVHDGSPYGWVVRHDATTSPHQAWAEQVAAVQLILDDPAQAGSTFSHPRLPQSRLDEAIDRFYTADVFMHSWDLARATGQEPDLDQEWAAELLAGMQQMEGMLRASGQYGPAHPVRPDAPVADRLAAFIGRDPDFRATAPR